MSFTAMEKVLVLFKRYAAHEQPLNVGGHDIRDFVTWVMGLECCEITDQEVFDKDPDLLYFKRSSKQTDFSTVCRRIRDDMIKNDNVRNVFVTYDNVNKTVAVKAGSEAIWQTLEAKAATFNFPKSLQQSQIVETGGDEESYEVATTSLFLEQPLNLESDVSYLAESTVTQQNGDVVVPSPPHPQPSTILHVDTMQPAPPLNSAPQFPERSGSLGVSHLEELPTAHLDYEELFPGNRPVSRASSMGPPDIFGDIDFSQCATPPSFSAPLQRSPARNNSMPTIAFHDDGHNSRKRVRDESVSIHPPYDASPNDSQRPYNFGDADKNAFETAIQAACEAFRTAQGSADTQVAQLSSENVKLATDLKYAKLEFEKQKIDLVAQARVALEHQKRAELALEQERRNVSRLDREKKEIETTYEQTIHLLSVKDSEIATLKKESEDAREEANELRTKGQQMLQNAFAASSIFGNFKIFHNITSTRDANILNQVRSILQASPSLSNETIYSHSDDGNTLSFVAAKSSKRQSIKFEL